MQSDRINALQDTDAERLARALAALQTARAEADHSTTTRDELLAIVSHDLRNPLSSIVTAAALLERLAGDGEEGDRARRYTQTITRCAERMNRLINDLLDFASIRHGKLVVERSAVLARELVQESVDVMGPLAVKKELRLTAGALEDLVVLCQRDRVLQILWKLIANAVKFTPQGGTITVSVTRFRDEAVFSVFDTGPGIPAEHLGQVFDRFWQGPMHKGNDGVGLGLYIVQGLVAAHGGRVWVENRPGGGASFSFTLPLAGDALSKASD